MQGSTVKEQDKLQYDVVQLKLESCGYMKIKTGLT
jgi:hypothetical protein